jgi:hypothetical protein
VDKIEVPPVLKYCTIRAYVGGEVQHHTFYTSVIDCIEWIQNLSGHGNMKKNSTDCHFTDQSSCFYLIELLFLKMVLVFFHWKVYFY